VCAAARFEVILESQHKTTSAVFWLNAAFIPGTKAGPNRQTLH